MLRALNLVLRVNSATGTSTRQSARLILDQSMFEEGGYPIVDVGDAQHIAVVDGKQGQYLIRQVERLDRKKPPPVLMSDVAGCSLFGIPPHLAPQYTKALAARTFDKTNVRFISLVRDSGTEAAINDSPNIKAARLGQPGAPISELAQIETVFQAATGSTVVLVSHVVGSNFVVSDPAQNNNIAIPVDSVRSIAKKYNIELIDLRCETARERRWSMLAVAVTTRFNTVGAVQALEGELLRILSDPHIGRLKDRRGSRLYDRLAIVC